MARISLRLSFQDETALGPGKVRLLEMIEETGSISAAGRAMKMSYHRAWDLAENLNQTFKEPLISKAPGGVKGGGAELTAAGREVVRRYRAIEAGVTKHSNKDLIALEKLLPEPKRKRR
ncbi:MAG TPA: LysR family transcriptional regulator [Candidatus Binatia bacterium]|nr:LysR family transcriptional regulator [Candidatus Binatia bacterium]